MRKLLISMRYCIFLLPTSACLLQDKEAETKREKWLKQDRIERKKTDRIIHKKNGKAHNLLLLGFKIYLYYCASILVPFASYMGCVWWRMSYISNRTKQYKSPNLNWNKIYFLEREFKKGQCPCCGVIFCSSVKKAKKLIPAFEAEKLKRTEQFYNESIERGENRIYNHLYGENEDKDKKEAIKQKFAAELNSPDQVKKIKEKLSKENKNGCAFEKKVIEIDIKQQCSYELVQELVTSDLYSRWGIERET